MNEMYAMDKFNSASMNVRMVRGILVVLIIVIIVQMVKQPMLTFGIRFLKIPLLTG